MPTDIVNQGATFLISDTKLYVSAVTLSSQENTKLLKKSKLVLKEQLTGININQKYQQEDQINI